MRPSVTARVIAIGCLLGSAGAMFAAPAAWADATPDETLHQMVELNRQALDAYKIGNGELAARLLNQALGLGQTNGLEKHELTARTYVHLGAVEITLQHDRARGMRAFADALAIRRDIKLTPAIATTALKRDLIAARSFKPTEPPSLAAAPAPARPPAPTGTASAVRNKAAVASDADAVFKTGAAPGPTAPASTAKPKEPEPAAPAKIATAAARTMVTKVGPATNDDEPDLPMHVPQPLFCPTPVEGPPGEEVRLHCLTQPEVKARKLLVFYRPAAGWDYTTVTMARTKKGWYRAIIPAKQVTGHSLQYYVEARGRANHVAASDGKDELPNVIMLKEGTPQIGVGALAAAHFITKTADAHDEDSPLELRVHQRERQAAQEEQAASRPRRAPHSLWLGLGLGSGYGWHLRLPLERHTNRDVTRGFSPAGLAHVTPEIGFQLTRRFALSLQSRHEYIPPSGSGDPEVSGSPPQTATAIFVRGHFLLGEAGNFQLIGTASGGYGSAVRLKVPSAPDSGLVASDTVVTGPFVVGPGVSVAYNFTSKLIAAIEGRALAGFGNLGVVGELNAGVQYAFYLIARDLDVFWHPCTQMRDHRALPPVEVVRARGCRLELADGRILFDAISSWWCKSLGHGHPRLKAALTAQLDAFEHVIVAGITHAPLVRLCERLVALANGRPAADWGSGALPGRRAGHFARVFLADNGSTAVEIALKMALQAQAQRGQPQRTRFAAFSNGYHGETMGALSVSDLGLYADPYRALAFPVERLEPLPYRAGPADPRWMDPEPEWSRLEAMLAPLAPTLAAIIYEPVLQAAGSMRLYSPALLARLSAWARAHDVFLIADEIAAGMGRVGTMLASHQAAPAAQLADVLPDFAVFSKGLTGGFLPLSAVLTTDSIYRLFDADHFERKAFLHSNTYTGHALGVAVGLAALDVYADEDVLGQVRSGGVVLADEMAALVERRPFLRNLRGAGLMAAVDLTAPDGSPLDPRRRSGYQVYAEGLHRGALLRPLGDTLYLFPPLTTPPDDLRAMVGVLADSVDSVFA